MEESNKSNKETCAPHVTSRYGNKEALQTVSAVLPQVHLSLKDSFLRTKGSGWLFLPILHTKELCHCRSPTWSQGWYVITIKKNEKQDASYQGDTVRRLGNMEHKFSQKDIGFSLFKKEAVRKSVEYCVDHKNSLCYLRAIQGHSGGIPMMPELMGYTSAPHNWKEYIFHRGCSWSVQYILWSGLILGEKESDKARQAAFFTSLNPFGENPDKEIELSRAQHLGLQFWQTVSFAIITHNPVPGDCIFRVIAEKLDRVLFERHWTPRTSRKVTLKSNWLVQQQQQQPICNEVVNSTSKVVAKWESQSGTRDGTRDFKRFYNWYWK